MGVRVFLIWSVLHTPVVEGAPPDVILRRPVSVGLLGPDPSVAAFNPSVVRESKEELTDERPGF